MPIPFSDAGFNITQRTIFTTLVHYITSLSMHNKCLKREFAKEINQRLFVQIADEGKLDVTEKRHVHPVSS